MAEVVHFHGWLPPPWPSRSEYREKEVLLERYLQERIHFEKKKRTHSKGILISKSDSISALDHIHNPQHKKMAVIPHKP